MNTDQTFVIVLVLVVLTVTGFVKALKGPIGEAVARRMGSKSDDPDRDAEIAELRTRLAELEERVDFTERVLLRQPEHTQVSVRGDQA